MNRSTRIWKKIIRTGWCVLFLFFIAVPATLAAPTTLGNNCTTNADCLSGKCVKSTALWVSQPNFCACASETDCEAVFGKGAAAGTFSCQPTGSDLTFGLPYCRTNEGVLSGLTSLEKSQVMTVAPEGVIMWPILTLDVVENAKQLGEICTDAKQCLSNNCVETGEISSTAVNKKICACNTQNDCTRQYGKPKAGASPLGWVCKTGTTSIPSGYPKVNYCDDGIEPKYPTTLKELGDAIKDDTATAATEEKDLAREAEINKKKSQTVVLIPPKISVPIPGLPSWNKVSISPGETLSLPWIADYILAIVKYALGMGSVAAIIMIVIGGVLYIMAGAKSSYASNGKDIMLSSMFGLIVILSSFLVLNAINPELTKMKELQIQSLTEQQLLEKNTGKESDDYGSSSDEESTKIPIKCPDGDTGIKSLKETDISKLEPIRKPGIRTNSEGKQYKGSIVDCSLFAQCTKGAIACRDACIAQLPSEKRSKPANASYGANPYFGLLDCNQDGGTAGGKRSIDYIVLHEGAARKSTVEEWWYRYIKKTIPIASHYFVDYGGNIYQVLDEGFVANHGVSNQTSIGIDIYPNCKSESEAQTLGLKKYQTCFYSDAMYSGLNKLLDDLKDRYKGVKITSHCEHTAGKEDPRNFDWRRIGEDNASHRCQNGREYFDISKSSMTTTTGCCVIHQIDPTTKAVGDEIERRNADTADECTTQAKNKCLDECKGVFEATGTGC